MPPLPVDGRDQVAPVVSLWSNSPMEISPHIERRLTDLEVKASFAEDLLEQLNHTVFRQQQQIEQLAREISELRQRIPLDTGMPTVVADEVPPHY